MLGVSQPALRGLDQRPKVVWWHDTAARGAEPLPAAVSSGDDRWRSGERRLERHETEGFTHGRMENHARGAVRALELVAAQHAVNQNAGAEGSEGPEKARREAADERQGRLRQLTEKLD
jgi:hypothetical protein